MQNALNIAPRRVHFEIEQMAKVINPQPTINPTSSDDRTNYERVFQNNQAIDHQTHFLD
jgi:hypothetical protein